MKVVITEEQYKQMLNEDLGVSRATIPFINIVLNEVTPIVEDATVLRPATVTATDLKATGLPYWSSTSTVNLFTPPVAERTEDDPVTVIVSAKAATRVIVAVPVPTVTTNDVIPVELSACAIVNFFVASSTATATEVA